ncbi:hypothetical protein SDC9_51189 [bioreactor metagenome]|jgi:3-oxoacyl-(acyl-carrier-protein) synthase|uniref:Beta-ketoacyl synthase-like N-terminal domain-containing protein n=2 Tax=root TaxID=1 RepID=A0A644WN72_9ZZZZ
MTRGNRRVSPFMIPMLISNMAADIIAIKTGFKGPSYSPVLICATSNQAIGEGFLTIKHGYTDAVIAVELQLIHLHFLNLPICVQCPQIMNIQNRHVVHLIS